MIETARKVYDVSDVMRVLHLSRNTVMCLLTSGKLRSVRAGRRWIIPSGAVDEFLGENRSGV